MYLECRICNRVTDHKQIDKQSSTYIFQHGTVSTKMFYICPHCNTGVSGTETSINFAGNIKSTFDKFLG